MLLQKIVRVILVTFCYILVTNGNKTSLIIQGFVPRENSIFVATSLEPAAHLAVEDVNNDSNCLANYTLKLTFVDTKVI